MNRRLARIAPHASAGPLGLVAPASSSPRLEDVAPLVLDEKPGAYRWWYFDAVSDDGKTSVVAIFFVGSVFSPYYAAGLKGGAAPVPADHVAVNVAVYREGRRPLWAFSEYGARRLQMASSGVRIASSSFERRADGSIAVHVDERRTLTGKPLAGTIVFSPSAARLPGGPVRLAGDDHQWRALAPSARVTARFADPDLSFEGSGYHDENWGVEPPARALRSWSWGRMHSGDRARVFFDTVDRAGVRKLSVFDSVSGAVSSFPAPRPTRPALGSWLLPTPVRFDAGLDDGRPVTFGPLRLLERAPFYARFLAPGTRFAGRTVVAVGEHVDFERLEAPFVQRMIAFRIARPDRGDRGLLP